MLKLEDLTKNAAVAGLEPGQVVRIVTTEPIGPDALTLYYKTPDGALRERMLFRADEASLSLADAGRPWSFDASGQSFKLAVEAFRISLAHLFDPMMAVHTSNVEPLPHQITAVYEAMLPRQPLRYVLADDPGAGKTIMAGLLIRELLMRADAKRVLIVAPGSLVEQWQDEMFEKFGLSFSIFSREQVEQSRGGNPFEDHDLLVARVDQLARADDLLDKLRTSSWDLIVVDEAHKLSANVFGNKVNKTRRYLLGELLGRITRHFLLMTATPHNGKEEDFQLFMSLLDPDRFHGRFRDGAHKVDVSDLMRRMIKEDLLKFDGRPLFPERRAYTVSYTLSQAEADLYAAVTDYVRTEFTKVDLLADGTRKGTVGFALTILQRRLASSPEAVYQSLRRRRSKLQSRVDGEPPGKRSRLLTDTTIGLGGMMDDAWEAAETLPPEDLEPFEDALADQATAAQTIQELQAEIVLLEALEKQAKAVVESGRDRKWEELSRLLREAPEMQASGGRPRKLIIFTEHRDTLNYLQSRIRELLGADEAVATIHGGVKREDRRRVQELFRNDPVVRVLLATDAAGEGVNLQNANLMVNYDLPWNPNRLEQRFGRIHRIGQTEVCHLWNLIAAGTREGDVFRRLFDKLEVEREALGGRVFDILGEVFEDRSLKDLLIEAVRYGAEPEVRARLLRKVEGALDTRHLEDIIRRNALCEVVMDANRLFAVKEEMEKAEARRLQPFFVRAFFTQAFEALGGELRACEPGRFEIANVPAEVRERDRRITGRERRYTDPVLRRYERVCFDKEHLRIPDRPEAPLASLLHPGHPLMQTVTDLVLARYRSTLSQGAVLVDESDLGVTPKVLFVIDHCVREGADPSQVASRRLQFVEIGSDGTACNAGWAPHLDLVPLSDADRSRVQDVLDARWLASGLENLALTHAAQTLVPQHFDEVRRRREESVEKTRAAVHERLVKEINYWSDRHIKLGVEGRAGKDTRLPLENIRRTIDELTARLQARERELQAMRHVVSATPVVVGGALVIPAGLLRQRAGDLAWSADAEARARVERLAMQAVIDAERAQGCEVLDVSDQKCGWDLTSIPPPVDGRVQESRHIEVKGRMKGQPTITVTRNEILYGLNQADKFFLAVVVVDGDRCEGPFYVSRPFTQEPDWATTSVNLDLDELLSVSTLAPLQR